MTHFMELRNNEWIPHGFFILINNNYVLTSCVHKTKNQHGVRAPRKFLIWAHFIPGNTQVESYKTNQM